MNAATTTNQDLAAHVKAAQADLDDATQRHDHVVHNKAWIRLMESEREMKDAAARLAAARGRIALDEIDRAIAESQPLAVEALRAGVQAAQLVAMEATQRHVDSSYAKTDCDRMRLAQARLTLAEADVVAATVRPSMAPDEQRLLDGALGDYRKALAVATRNLDRPTFRLAHDQLTLAEADLDQALQAVHAAVQARRDAQAQKARVKDAPLLKKEVDALAKEADALVEQLDQVGRRLNALAPRLKAFEQSTTSNGLAVYHPELPTGVPGVMKFFHGIGRNDTYANFRTQWKNRVERLRGR